jgi:hypothetical protein
MKILRFPAQAYIEKKGKLVVDSGDAIVGTLELLWAGVQNSPCSDLKLREHKANKRLKKKLREITCYRDEDKDSRISLLEQTLILEEEEIEVMKKLLNANSFTAAISEELGELWDIIDSAEDYKLKQV